MQGAKATVSRGRSCGCGNGLSAPSKTGKEDECQGDGAKNHGGIVGPAN
ncbi:hypothetical protein ACPOL_2139 [Acidisarcina polymorpha]|uniref:Uncharacterized protein n=1 Tax=Acidisarcina polymorpha TaxID=2211140 RepID=A0A2Z5FX49_9BACT|nr:hypothetical protein ACPOL_2139 [Acidisarcina polymorpha]